MNNKRPLSAHPQIVYHQSIIPKRNNIFKPFQSLMKKRKCLINKSFRNQFNRILPCNMHQDKERLYSETLQLKNQNHSQAKQITKLKTRISLLEKDESKQHKKDDKINNKCHNAIINSLKHSIKDLHCTIEKLTRQNSRLKKATKYTRIQELETQIFILTEELLGLKGRLQEEISRNINEYLSAENFKDLEIKLQEKVADYQKVKQENFKFEISVRRLQEQLKQNRIRHLELIKKLSRQLNLEKRRRIQGQSKFKNLLHHKNKLEISSKSLSNKKRATRTSQQVNSEIDQQSSKDEYQPYSEGEQELSETLQNIKELLSYRLKAQEYNLDFLSFSISNSLPSSLNYKQLSTVLSNKPFMLPDNQMLISYLIRNKKVISSTQLIQRFSQFFHRLECWEADAKSRIVQQINQVICNLGKKLQQEFKKKESQPGLIGKYDFWRILQEEGFLSTQSIEYCTSCLCLYSNNMQALCYKKLFQHFNKKRIYK